MRDISLHVLDIAMNSINAQATLIEIEFIVTDDTYELTIKDNGKGMTEEELQKVRDPFFTSRLTRKVGLGIPMLEQNVLKTNGHFEINSIINQGTIVEAVFNKHHIDCLPVGDMAETIISLIMIAPQIDYIIKLKSPKDEYILNTQEIKEILQDVEINNINVISLLRKDLKIINKSLK